MRQPKTASGEALWNRRAIKRSTRQAAFRKGWRSWLALVAVCFLFSFLGSDNSGVTSFVHSLDELLGLAPADPMSNVELLKEYVLQLGWVGTMPLLSHEAVLAVIDALSADFAWLINLLAANAAYFARNPGEVWGSLLLVAVVSGLVRFFFQNVLVVGECRYVMEQRFQARTPFRRMLSPFHRRYLLNLVWVMFRTNLQLALWWLTVAGGVYKSYQYRMIPYLMAEDPALPFREAMALSKAMTRGYKWKMFVLDLSCWYLLLVKMIPLAGLLAAAPYEAARDGEVYFTLRRIHGGGPEPGEPAFDGPALWEEGGREGTPEFLLPDLISPREDIPASAYRLTDVIFLFFLFSFVGWLWEVGLHLVQYHEIVNRGTMYGPWLPIYGAGGVLAILLLDRFKGNLPRTFLLIMVTAGALEFSVSWGLDFFLNTSYWSYEGWFANLNGRICLAGLLAFAIGGSCAIYIIGPYVRKASASLSPAVRYGACALLCALFAADLAACLIFGLNSGAGVGGGL